MITLKTSLSHSLSLSLPVVPVTEILAILWTLLKCNYNRTYADFQVVCIWIVGVTISNWGWGANRDLH